ncbi:MAG: DUF1003 domain-containing protein [Pseudomonadota bacterium]
MYKDDLKDLVISGEQEREEQIHELIRGKRSLDINKELSNSLTFGEKMADRMASFAGSWSFLIFFGVIVISWAIINSKLIFEDPLDPFPYVFLNLLLACVSSLQAPIIMMSQNRQSQKDRLRSENDYLINLKSEIILEDLHIKIDEIIQEQLLLKKELENIMMDMEKKNGRLENNIDGKSSTGREEPGLYS